MKIAIDEKICGKHGLSLEETLMALAIRMSTKNQPQEVIDNMVNREIVVFKSGKTLVTQHWSDVLDEIICDSSGGIDDEERLLNLAQKMRECFPQGKMPGTPYYYRCNNAEVIKKLKKFFLQYGNYSDDEIVNACKRFVASFNGNYRYMPLIKYFISKMKPEVDELGNAHNVEFSPLADYLENKEEEGAVANTSDDWMLNVKN